MDFLQQMNRSLQYIEDHITEEIDVNKVAKLAYCSEYHFRRMFSSLAGVSLSEYIRRRRLTLAAFDLLNADFKVIDVAMTYQYQSPDSFTKAFQKLHGILPSQVKENGHLLKAYPQMTFQLTIKGGSEMQYRIEEKEAFQIVGLKKRVPLIYEGVNPEIEKMWLSLTMEQIEEWKSLSNIEPSGLISASTNFSERTSEYSELDHYIGAATTNEVTITADKLEVPAQTWVIFTAVGKFPEALQNVWARIYSEWFPSSQYEQTGGPEILWNEDKDMSKPNYKSEIWIPVIKREI
ncbi:AraC family transcriptional regulator [Alkalihalobacillus sp. 1P02AB]|uniref:AraC family transcriptional regulator n=1 Tax=Alkalihalobacillus sp. 1P02AB TaxID=3132260 RepID=UPI0039A67E71